VPKTVENVNKLKDLLISPLSKRLNTKGFRKYSFNIFLEIPAILDLSSDNKKPSKWINLCSGFHPPYFFTGLKMQEESKIRKQNKQANGFIPKVIWFL
jgi:hypothetical protein